MASRLEIFNMALLHLGESTKTSEKEIDSMPFIYETVLREELTKNSFLFSYRDDILIEKTNGNYQLPADFLYLIESNIEGRVIEDEFMLNESNYSKRDVIIKYIKRVDEEYFPSFFINLLSFALAKKVALSYNTRQEVLAGIENGYVKASRTASDSSKPTIDFGRRLFW